MVRLPAPLAVVLLSAALSCGTDDPSKPVAGRPSDAQAADGKWIHWEEYYLDSQVGSGVDLRGADGLALADLDKNGALDIVVAHEDSGHIRAAFAGENARDWQRISLAEGPDAQGVEDVDAGDLSGDGWPDVVAACEGGRLVYLQNPAEPKPAFRWQSMVVEASLNRGSWIRTALADLDGDGRLEVVAVNKGAADGGLSDEPRPISVFRVNGDPLLQESWTELSFGEYDTPINAEPHDMDGDGDVDLFAGARGERRVFWLENQSANGDFVFVEHEINLDGPGKPSGFNVKLFDFSGDGRPDALLALGAGYLGWLEQPADPAAPWPVHPIGTFAPDSMTGFGIGDVDGDSDPDVMAGSYSRGARLEDDPEMGVDDALGRIGWFANPGDPAGEWTRHDIVRRKRGMFDDFAAMDLDQDGWMDFVGTRGNSGSHDGLFWLRQERDDLRMERLTPASLGDSESMPVPPTPEMPAAE